MTIVIEIGIEIWRILLDSAPYVVLGIVAAGFIRIYINQEQIARHLQRGKYSSVLKASLFGVPMPL